jgi:hypothetical protein
MLNIYFIFVKIRILKILVFDFAGELDEKGQMVSDSLDAGARGGSR